MPAPNDIQSFVAALLAIAVALATTHLVIRWIPQPPLAGRFATIDGLRGYLGFFVFLHHAAIWQAYSATGVWTAPPNRLYTAFGNSSVQVFFMITAFLFFTKILNDRKSKTDFLALLISRIARLTPLYLVAIAMMMLVVFSSSHWQFKDNPLTFASNAAKWAGFAIVDSPDLNGFPSTGLILSGVYWTLKYEWVFYMALPLLALIVGMRPSFIYILGSLAFLLTFASPTTHYLPFVGGIVAAVVVRSPTFKRWASTNVATSVAVILILIHLGLRGPSLSYLGMAALAAAFTIVASGNSLGGIFSHRLSRALGEFTYGLYLMHGLILFVFFKLLIGQNAAAQLTSSEYWMLIVLMTPLLIVISALAFALIERPAMERTKAFTQHLRAKRQEPKAHIATPHAFAGRNSEDTAKVDVQTGFETSDFSAGQALTAEQLQDPRLLRASRTSKS